MDVSSRHWLFIVYEKFFSCVIKVLAKKPVVEKSFIQRNAAILWGINLDDQSARVS